MTGRDGQVWTEDWADDWAEACDQATDGPTQRPAAMMASATLRVMRVFMLSSRARRGAAPVIFGQRSRPDRRRSTFVGAFRSAKQRTFARRRALHIG